MKGLDTRGIAALLPHRFPFQFLDRVLEIEDGRRVVACKNVSVNEPFFAGHFPDNPIMPGVLICEALAQAGALLIHRAIPTEDGRVVVLTGIDKARFRRPVRPADQLVLEVVVLRRRSPLWKMRGAASVDGQVVAETEFLLTETEREGF